MHSTRLFRVPAPVAVGASPDRPRPASARAGRALTTAVLVVASALALPGQSGTPVFRYLGMPGEPDPVGATSVDGALNNRGEAIIHFRGWNQRNTAWLVDTAGRNRQVGFVGGVHEAAPGGEAFSFIRDITERGWIHGVSARYAPRGGATSWVGTTGGLTRRVGFYDALHTRADGFRRTQTLDLTECGWVLGYSERFAGGADAGITAWLAHVCGWIRPIGLYDAVHTSDSGRQVSEPMAINARGYAIGASESFVSPGRSGRTAWIAAPDGRTWRVGYYDPKHTASDGFQLSQAHGINTAGEVIGTSWRFVGYGGPADWGGDLIGQSAWVATVRGSIRAVGLYGAPHKTPDGFHYQGPNGTITESGFVAGTALRFDAAGAQAGQSAWLASRAGATRRIGFYDAEHTRSDGVVYNTVGQVNEHGLASGHAARYAGNAPRGWTAWVAGYDTPARRVGLTGPEYTDPDGSQVSVVQHVFDNGSVLGRSHRTPVTSGMAGNTYWVVDRLGTLTVLGDVASDTINVAPHGVVWWGSWAYDTNTGTRIEVPGRIFGVTRQGVLYGQSHTDRAFVWIPERGFLDVADNLDVNVREQGWERLASVIDVSPSGHVLGSGLRAGTLRTFAPFLVRFQP